MSADRDLGPLASRVWRDGPDASRPGNCGPVWHAGCDAWHCQNRSAPTPFGRVAMAEAKDKVKGAIDKAADKAKDVTDKVSEKTKESARKTGDKVQEAG